MRLYFISRDPYKVWALLREGYSTSWINRELQGYEADTSTWRGVYGSNPDVQSLNTYGQREDRAPESAESEAGASRRGDGEVL